MSEGAIECPAVQRRTLVAVVLVLGVLILAGSWFGFSGRQGLSPTDASEEARAISDLYIFIGVFAVLIFLSVAIPLALIIGRYRERGLPREVEGPQVRGNTRLELAWTIASIAIVLVIVSFTLYKASALNDPAEAAASENAVPVLVDSRQFYFRYVYDNGVVALDRLRLPVDRVADLSITAPEHDVIHSYWVPELGGKMDAIPGTINHLHLTPDEIGVYDGRCAELCGIQHTGMVFEVEVMEQEAFDAWLAEQGREQVGLGEDIFEYVCSRCHFAAPEYAPNIIGNPTLGDPERLKMLVTNGIGDMPAVGKGWSEEELDALAEYVGQFAGEATSDGR